MLTRVRLKNFKLHAATEIEAAPVTVFIGPNNSGKSSIFQALLLLRQAATRGCATLCRQDPTVIPSLIDIGEFEHTVRRSQNEILLAGVYKIASGKRTNLCY